MPQKLYECKSCNRKFNDYEKSLTETDYCIFHCKKNNWYKIKLNGWKDWSNSENKREYFWNEFHDYIKIIDEKENNKKSPEKIFLLNRYSFKNFIFPKCIGESFDKIYENINEKIKINKDVYFENCQFLDSFEIWNISFNKVISFHEIESNDVIKLSNCEFNSLVVIDNNKKFKGEFSFYNSIFLNEVRIENSIVERLELFSCEFNSLLNLNNSIFTDINFEYTKLKGFNSFMKSTIKNGLDFESTIITGELKLLGLNNKVKNRETARIIKNSFEKHNNIIEANKYYALEMKEREKELEEDKKNGKNLFEWLVFKIHGITSNHSQDWTFALFWIISIGLLGSLCTFYSKDNFINLSFTSILGTLLLIASVLALNNIFKPSKKVEYSFLIFNFYLIYGYKTQDIFLSDFAKNLNPFSIMSGKDDITFGTLIFKIIIAYLIYQLIISIRQNTRRK